MSSRLGVQSGYRGPGSGRDLPVDSTGGTAGSAASPGPHAAASAADAAEGSVLLVRSPLLLLVSTMVAPTDEVVLGVAEAVSEWVQPLRLVLHFLRRRA